MTFAVSFYKTFVFFFVHFVGHERLTNSHNLRLNIFPPDVTSLINTLAIRMVGLWSIVNHLKDEIL